MSAHSAQHRAYHGKALRVAAVCLIITATVVTVLLAHRRTTSTGVHSALPTPHPQTDTPQRWDTAGERVLASLLMRTLPPQAAQPQALTTRQSGPPIVLLTPTVESPVGALSQLRTMDQAMVAGGDPDTYDHGYRALSLPGAPDPTTTGLYSVLVNFRAAADLPDTGPVESLSVAYDITEGQVKGIADDGRFVVACVLGGLTVQYQDTTVSAGVGGTVKRSV